MSFNFFVFQKCINKWKSFVSVFVWKPELCWLHTQTLAKNKVMPDSLTPESQCEKILFILISEDLVTLSWVITQAGFRIKGLFSCPFCMNTWISWTSFYSEAGAGAAHPAQAVPCISQRIPPHVCETSELSVQAHVGSCLAHPLLSLIFEEGQRILCSVSPHWNGFWPQCFQTWGPERVTSAGCGITVRRFSLDPKPRRAGTLGMLLGCGCPVQGWKHWAQKEAVEWFCSCHLAVGSFCISSFCFLKHLPHGPGPFETFGWREFSH